jgi:hypothetical protein
MHVYMLMFIFIQNQELTTYHWFYKFISLSYLKNDPYFWSVSNHAWVIITLNQWFQRCAPVENRYSLHTNINQIGRMFAILHFSHSKFYRIWFSGWANSITSHNMFSASNIDPISNDDKRSSTDWKYLATAALNHYLLPYSECLINRKLVSWTFIYV